MASPRDEVFRVLRNMERYNPGNLALFTNFVKETCQDGTYELEPYLAVLKLYQFNPAKFDLETTKTILLKTLTNLPANDFTLCLYLLPEEQHQEPSIAAFIELAYMLESCMFSQFWEYLKLNANILAAKVKITHDKMDQHVPVEIKGFTESIREYVAYVIKITYQVISTKIASDMLGISGAELQEFAGKKGWKIQADDTIFIAHQDDIVKSKNIVESIHFENLASLMAASQAV